MMAVFGLLWVTLTAPSELVIDDNVALVRAHCTPCHSEKLIIQNTGTRDDWRQTIRWMQAEQNLWPLEPKTEEKILTYLATNYGPRRAFRRPPLHPSLQPPNPMNALAERPAIPSRISTTASAEPPSSTASHPDCACDAASSHSGVWAWALVMGLLAILRRHPRRSSPDDGALSGQ
ncbi:MAG: hypothetical protein VX589_09465 [Myxococcota bacterium]|nr:hypothetical protein [Myxococcota bacterium]